jgi:Putative prokaryotic signal transducing protein
MVDGERRRAADPGMSAAGEGATVPVAVVASRVEAELIVGLLRNNGLWAVVSADDAGGLEPQLQVQGVRVLVPASDEASARRLLAAADDAPS